MIKRQKDKDGSKCKRAALHFHAQSYGIGDITPELQECIICVVGNWMPSIPLLSEPKDARSPGSSAGSDEEE
jgi:hypothetical protein